ncbi:MAG: hypothetical protein HC909_01935 [Blastochloris sp.]|nr:hypothetical protein [Blastochloris sp.]
MLEVAYQFRDPFQLSFARYEKTFGEPRPAPLDVALAETISWWRRQSRS